ncbi:MAG: Tad domain-containing protein [Gemmataceae bacterium]
MRIGTKIGTKAKQRRGAIILLFVLALISLAGLLALALDVGVIAVARSQAQNAADTAAMTGARTINGSTSQNVASAPKNAINAAMQNKILNQNVSANLASINTSDSVSYTSGNVTIQVGSYEYKYNDTDSSKEKFESLFPRTDNTVPYSAVKATITGQSNNTFARVFGLNSTNIQATAIAAHRPRDIMIIMDLSGSMRFQSLPGIPLSGTTAQPSATSARDVSMNPESVFPQFGHYSNTSSAALKGTSAYSTGSEQVDLANISTTTDSGPPIIEDFYKNAAGVTPTASDRAFTRSSDGYATTPGGYNYLKITGNTGATYAATVKDIVNQTTHHANFEANGYDQYVTAKTDFYTEGPGYWGKTFFIWPPDPRGSLLDANTAANHANNGAKDWRQRFFFKYNTSTGKLGWLDHNNILFNPSGSPNSSTTIVRDPDSAVSVTENGSSVSYKWLPNYAAIFHWLKNQSPTHFPSQIRAGRIKYYDAIPDPSDTTLNDRFWKTQTLSDLNERFWRDYVNFVLGISVTGTSGGWCTYSTTKSSVPLSALIGNGDYYSWGTIAVTQKPDVTSTSTATVTAQANAAYASGYSGTVTLKSVSATIKAGDYVYFGTNTTRYRVVTVPSATQITLDRSLAAAVSSGTSVKVVRQVYMSYTDNPYRPRHQFWFGPMTWVDWLGNYNTQNFMWPGNVHEAQAWACKVGIQTAIDDIQNNHPNDFIGMTFFSSPSYNGTDGGHHNRAIVPLGRNYQQLKDSLWFPPSTVTGTATEITPYDKDFDQVPRANGGTAPGMGFMIAFNQLSSSLNNLRLYATPTTTYRGNAGGLGRRGAQRILVFETDGAPNTSATSTFVSSGTDSYYKVRIKDPSSLSSSSNVEWPSAPTYSSTDVYNVVKQICALDTASPPGHSTTRKPVNVYPIGYGSLFDPANTSTAQTNALNFMQSVGYYGNTAADTSGANFPDWARIYGTNDQRVTRMQAAFTKIMQNGVQVTLIE